MNIFVNQKPMTVASGTSLSDLLRLADAKPPFAVAINKEFIPKGDYSQVTINNDDHIEIISPITGG